MKFEVIKEKRRWFLNGNRKTVTFSIHQDGYVMIHGANLTLPESDLAVEKVNQLYKKEIEARKEAHASMVSNAKKYNEAIEKRIKEADQKLSDLMAGIISENGLQRQEVSEETPTSGRGGYRPNAGRPSMGETKKVSLTLDQEIWHYLDIVSGGQEFGSKSAYLRYLVERDYQTHFLQD